MKQEGHDKLTIGSWSLPTRERGLKPAPNSAIATAPCVAPYAGAWIETIINKIAPILLEVAPYAGAWIETQDAFEEIRLVEGRSLRGSVD